MGRSRRSSSSPKQQQQQPQPSSSPSPSPSTTSPSSSTPPQPPPPVQQQQQQQHSPSESPSHSAAAAAIAKHEPPSSSSSSALPSPSPLPSRAPQRPRSPSRSSAAAQARAQQAQQPPRQQERVKTPAAAPPSAAAQPFWVVTIALLAIIISPNLTTLLPAAGDAIWHAQHHLQLASASAVDYCTSAVASFIFADPRHMARRNEKRKFPSPSSPSTPSSLSRSAQHGTQPESQPEAAPLRFSTADLPRYFGVDPLHDVHVDPVIARFVQAHDLTKDVRFVYRSDASKRVERDWSWVFDEDDLDEGNGNGGSPRAGHRRFRYRDDERVYVRHVSEEKGYGLFAKVPIPKGNPVIIYAGLLTNNSVSDYMWRYPADNVLDDQGNPIHLYIDSRFRGNMARFVNHDESPNAASVYVPHRGLWKLLYMATRDVAAGEEVTVSYGPQYWAAAGSAKPVSTAVAAAADAAPAAS